MTASMQTVTVKPNQTIFDLAAQHYGNAEAVGEILRNNPELTNEDAAKTAVGIDAIADKNFYIDLPVRAGTAVGIDTDSHRLQKSVTKQIETDITTFNL